MSHYDFCCNNMGRPVRIVTHNGEIHRGVIRNVNRSKVFLEPFGGNNRMGGYGIGYYGGGYGGYGRGGFGLGIALGAIATIAFLPLFFW
ncbi:hypothetical protein [Gracilibacillus salinarum]|uniref:Spore coat protein n=1 Tax=Gracilibacillus salinarum TaxID=2932255 RepID=A0ABY4GSI8_9BACI|nr:hypothetical protein [Gracilibacillus salinarum]UOQ87353.1 hypothetical protein MUN87_10895 [Gracilibacillus salinarum]